MKGGLEWYGRQGKLAQGIFGCGGLLVLCFVLGVIANLLGMGGDTPTTPAAPTAVVAPAGDTPDAVATAEDAPEEPTEEPATEEPTDVPPTEDTANVNLAAFNSIQTGMSYEEVVAILGEEGSVLSETEVMGIKTTMYMWYDDTGISNMNVMIQNGKVMSKAQLGLK